MNALDLTSPALRALLKTQVQAARASGAITLRAPAPRSPVRKGPRKPPPPDYVEALREVYGQKTLKEIAASHGVVSRRVSDLIQSRRLRPRITKKDRAEIALWRQSRSSGSRKIPLRYWCLARRVNYRRLKWLRDAEPKLQKVSPELKHAAAEWLRQRTVEQIARARGLDVSQLRNLSNRYRNSFHLTQPLLNSTPHA